MLYRFTIAAAFVALAATTQPALAQSPAPAASAPDAALTARFSTFLTGVLSGHAPTSGISDAMKTALTSDKLSQIDQAFAPLGAFQSLQFVRQDSLQGYQRYHYTAVFAKGTLPMIFVLDSGGNIAGFFRDTGQ